jgi:hypothetical protein
VQETGRKALLIACIAVTLVACINFFSYLAECERVGGSPISSAHSDGRFYVSEHGRTTEVDETTWHRMRWHSRSLAVTHPLAGLAMVYLLSQYIFPASMFRGPRADISATEQRVRAHGPVLWGKRCGGRIGKINISPPLLRLAVYRNGLWIKPAFITPFAIPSAQLTGVEVRGDWMSKWIEVAHTSTQVASPIRLYSSDAAMPAHLRSLLARSGRT